MKNKFKILLWFFSEIKSQKIKFWEISTFGFNDLLKSSHFYVDKTDFIKEVWSTGNSPILITMPRRWGKSVMLEMLSYFLEIPFSNNVYEIKFKEKSYLLVCNE